MEYSQTDGEPRMHGMNKSFRLSIVASVVAALCIAPAAFAKPKNGEENGGGQDGQTAPGQSGKSKKHGRSAAVQAVAPGTSAPQASGRSGTRSGTQGPGAQGPGGPGIVILPPPPPPYYHRTYRRSSSYVDDSNVTAVQRALKTRGYYSGPVDGDAGSGTRAAIRGFREDNGLGSSSAIDSRLLGALGL